MAMSRRDRLVDAYIKEYRATWAGLQSVGYRQSRCGSKGGDPSFETRIVERSNDGGAGNFFIRAAQIGEFFEEPRKKFQAQVSEGILFVDAAEKEYESDVYFWTNGEYRHEPVDY